jgi:hypothetical protein
MNSYKSIDDARDDLETTIIMALSMRSRIRSKSLVRIEKSKGPRGDKEHLAMDAFCPPKPEYPRHMFGFDVSGGRLFATSLSDIVVDPVRAISRGIETAIIHGGNLKWLKIQPMPRPRGIVALTNRPHTWFAGHFRQITPAGSETYVRWPFAFDGDVCLLKPLGWKGYDAEAARAEDRKQLAMTLSLFEDAIRAGSILATVEEAARLSFPIGESGYKSFLRLRDGYKNTPTGRRNPILHWCSDYIRRRDPIGDIAVAGHHKGATEIKHGDLKLSIVFNDGYGALLK